MRLPVIAAYGVLYVVWGSTYLAMKIAVTTLPAMYAASMRFAFSGLLLFTVGLALNRGARHAPVTRAHVVTSALQALFLLVIANAGMMWALRTVPSGTAALIAASTPLFMALFSGDTRPRTWAGLSMGLVGITILVEPWHMGDDEHVPLAGAVVVLITAVSWAFGSLLGKNRPLHPSNTLSSGMQMLFGAVAQFSIAVVIGERVDMAAVTSTSLWAIVYLAVFGSVIGFSCFAWLLRVEPPSRVSTYAYVNPVVAVLLGAAIGGEPLTPQTGIATVIIVGSVVLILGGRRA